VSYTIGLDMGGTNIKGGLVHDREGVKAQHSIPTEADEGPGHVMDRLAELARELAERAAVPWERIDGIGVGTPGPIDENGVVLEAPNMPGWKSIPLEEQVAQRTERRVRVVNDANAAAYGEYWAGAARGERVEHMVFLTLGTGLGGGVVTGGRLFLGAHHAGAELGHAIVEVGGRRCACGQRGCIEQYASATAISREAHRRIELGESTDLPDHPTTEQVFDAAAVGDRLAGSVIEEATRYLGAACVTFVRAFDPQMIVLGGGVAAAGDALLERVRQAFHDQTWHVRPERVNIALSELGNAAGFTGAAGMVVRSA
jgi:glucokinase